MSYERRYALLPETLTVSMKSIKKPLVTPPSFPIIRVLSCSHCRRFHETSSRCLTEQEKEEAITFPCFWAREREGWKDNWYMQWDVEINSDLLRELSKEKMYRKDSINHTFCKRF